MLEGRFWRTQSKLLFVLKRKISYSVYTDGEFPESLYLVDAGEAPEYRPFVNSRSRGKAHTQTYVLASPSYAPSPK